MKRHIEAHMQFIDLKTQYKRIQAGVEKGLKAVLEHGQYVMGPEIDALEKQLAEWVGAKHAIAVASGTDALLLALLALDIRPGDEVITVPFSMFATVEPIVLLGATPIFVDIDLKTFNMDPAKLEKAITSKTKAIMPVSLYGQCVDFDAINAIANKYNLPVIEDAAQSFGARYKKGASCGLTTLACTSFYPAKPLGGYGDSGACFTNDAALAQKIKSLQNHGQDRRYHHTLIGVNGRMDSFQAVVLLEKLTLFAEELQRRREIAAYYDEGLASCREFFTTPYVESYNSSTYAQYTLTLTSPEIREKLQGALQAKNIPTMVHYPEPIHHQPAIRDLQLYSSQSHPCSEEAAKRVLSLPMHPYLEKEEQTVIIEALTSFF